MCIFKNISFHLFLLGSHFNLQKPPFPTSTPPQINRCADITVIMTQHKLPHVFAPLWLTQAHTLLSFGGLNISFKGRMLLGFFNLVLKTLFDCLTLL